MPYYDQSAFDIRCEWGMQGLKNLAPAKTVVIVDVLSFTTSVEIAVSRGVTVLPFPPDEESAESYARQHGAQLAEKRSSSPGVLSLSPASLINASSGKRLVLPSPNGSALSFQASSLGAKVIAGSLRNSATVAEYAASIPKPVSVIPAGERWEDRSLRPALEDLIGAGAIISRLSGKRSPEAELAVTAFEKVKENLLENLQSCSSGTELIDRGFGKDVELASELNVSGVVPVLEGREFVNISNR